MEKIKDAEPISKLEKSESNFKKKSKIDETMKTESSSPFYDEELFISHINLYENLVSIIESDKENELLNIYERELVSINKMQSKMFEFFGIYSDKWVEILIKVIYLSNPNYFLESIEVIGEALEKDTELKRKIMK